MYVQIGNTRKKEFQTHQNNTNWSRKEELCTTQETEFSWWNVKKKELRSSITEQSSNFHLHNAS